MSNKDGGAPLEAESRKLLDQAAIDALGAEIALEISAAKEPEKLAGAAAGLSSEALERQHVIFEMLESQAADWRARIAAVANIKGLDAITNLASKNGKYTTAPGFVVGNALVRLLRDNAITDEVEATVIKGRAQELQSELRISYLAKQAELYPTQVAAQGAPAKEADPKQAWISSTREFSLPQARHFPAAGVWYETLDGRRYHITKKIGDPYHISGPDIKGTPSISQEKIIECAQADDWRRERKGDESTSSALAEEVIETERPISVEQHLNHAQDLSARWIKLRDEYGVGRLLDTIREIRGGSPMPNMANAVSWLDNRPGVKFFRGAKNQEDQRILIENLIPDMEGMVRDAEASRDVLKEQRKEQRLAELESLAERLRATYSDVMLAFDRGGVVSDGGQERVHDIFGEFIVIIEGNKFTEYSLEDEVLYQEHRSRIESLIRELIAMRLKLKALSVDEPVSDVNVVAEVGKPILEVGKSTEFEKSIRRKLIRQKVEHAAEGYYFFAEDGTREALPLDEEEARKLLEGWKPVEDESAPDFGPGFLKEGETAEFTMDNSSAGSMQKFKRENRLYYRIRPEDGSLGKPYTEQEMQALAVKVGLRRAAASVESPSESVAVDLERLPEGGKAVYVNRSGERVAVERKGDTYQITDAAGDVSGFMYDLEWMKRIAEEENWQLGSEDSVGGGETARVPSDDEAFRLARDAEIVRLREEVTAERTAYIEKEQEQSGAWSRIIRMFPKIRHNEKDASEVETYHERYREKLFEWKNAELERLRNLGLPMGELKAEMAAVVREFEFNEAEQLYDERRHLRLKKESVPFRERMDEIWDETAGDINRENGSTREEIARSRIKFFLEASPVVGQAAVASVDKVGAAVSKFNKTKYGKYVLAASLAGTGAVALGATGGGALVGVLALKRLLSGASVAYGAGMAMEGIASRRRESKKEKAFEEGGRVYNLLTRVSAETSGERLRLGGNALPTLQSLDEYLTKGIGQIDKKARDRQKFARGRKLGAFVAGAAIGGLIPKEWFEASFSLGSAQAATIDTPSGGRVLSGPPIPRIMPDLSELERGVTPSDGVFIPAANPSGVPVEVASAPVVAPAAVSVPGPDRIQASPNITLESQTKLFLSEYKVRAGDSIWKIATKSVEGVPDMDTRSGGRFAKLLELKLQEKLMVIDPKIAEAAGFTVDAEGRFTPHHIQADAKLELGKLISVDEMTKLVEEAKSDSSITLAAAHTPMPSVDATPTSTMAVITPEPTAAERVAIERARIEAVVPVPSATERTEILGQFNMSTELVGPKGDVMRYVETLPKEGQERLFHVFKKLSVEILQTNEVMGGEIYEEHYDPTVHPELARTRVGAVIADHKMLGKSPFTRYDRIANPLHGSQMETVVKFARAAAKAFGAEVANPRPSESVQGYLLRMAAIADNQKVKIPGYARLMAG